MYENAPSVKTLLGRSPAGFHRIAYTEWKDVQVAEAARPAVICAHGLTRNGRDFDTLAQALSKVSSVFCPDIVGRGKSDWLADPAFYIYPQYLADMTALIARTGAHVLDWVGTSMGGLIGLLPAAEPGTPIRRLVINDVGPFIPVLALKRIGGYVAATPEFSDSQGAEAYMRQIYKPFGDLTDENWRHLVAHGTRVLPNGKLTLSHDPAIAQPFLELEEDVDLWAAYDRIRCPVLLLRGTKSDILSAAVAEEMTRRGPKARLVEFPKIGHAPALLEPTQIAIIAEFLHQ